MEVSATQPKETRGLRKLWLKVRTSMKPGGISTSATTASKPTPAKAAVIAPPPEMAPKAPETKSTMTAKDEATKRFERAQAIFKKYDMELDPADWVTQPKGDVERVHKQPRMRVRWTCHECKATFGRDTVCKDCTHERCKQCIRYPPKKKKTVPKDTAAAVAPATKAPTTGPCHECRTEFAIGASQCSNCQHNICDQCLKETIVESPATAPPVSTAA